MTFPLQIMLITYNRNALALDTVTSLAGQLSDSARLLVMDNCSDVPLAETLAPVMSGPGGQWMRIVRNVCNVGADANLLRGLELSEGEWTWIVCDDDLVESCAVTTIKEAIADPSLIFVNFYSPHVQHPVRTAARVFGEVGAFVRGMDDYGALMFAPACVVRTDVMQAKLRTGYQYLYAYSTPMAMLMRAMQDGIGSVLLSEKTVVRYRTNYHPEHSWSFLSYTHNVALVAEVLLRRADRLVLLRRIREGLSIYRLFWHGLVAERDSRFDGNGRRLFRQAVRRLYQGSWFSAAALQARLLALAILFPRLMLAFARAMGRA